MAHKQPVNLQEETRQITVNPKVVECLQLQTANALVLFMNYKHYHWQTAGPLFRDLHLMFDEFAEAVIDTVDEFAERVRMIGPDSIATLEEALKTASVKSSEVQGRNLRHVIEEADRNSIRVIKELREAAKIAEDSNDPGTVDLCSKVVQIHEKQEWWLRDILKTGDALTSKAV
jgi:starvation-inducible DNA-binding protein